MTTAQQPVSEAVLFDAYRNDPAVLRLQAAGRTERRPCVCRGVVTADPEDPQPGVEEHNATILHEAWRAQRR